MGRVAVALLLIGLCVGVRDARDRAFEQHRSSQRYEDTYFLPPAEWLPLMSLGFHAAAADLLWCRSLVYFGTEAVHRGQVKHLFEYTDAIIALDPDFREPYRWASVATLYRAGDLTIADGLRGADYLRRAVKRWPNDGELAWNLGSVLRFELVPLARGDAKLKDDLEREAADLLSTAATLGAGPPWLALNSSNLLLRLGRTEQAIRHLEEVYATIDDEDTKEIIAKRLAALRSESYAEAIRATNQQFERDRLESFPYLSPTMFLLLGKKASAAATLELLKSNFLGSDGGNLIDADDLASQPDVTSSDG